MKTIEIKCDSCNADITATGSHPRFRLRLSAEALPHTSNMIHSVLVYPPIVQDKYFCGLGCLESWTEKPATNKAA